MRRFESSNATPIVLGIAVLLQTLDGTSVAVALPAIAHDLRESTLAVSTIISTYLLGSAVAVPACGWLADRFGGRNVFLMGILTFMLASLGCAMAQSLQDLNAWRFVEGAAGAFLIPVGRMVIMRSTRPEDRVKAYTTFVLPALMGPMVGPLVGGFFVEYASWQWLFVLNIPLGFASLLAVLLLVDNVRESQPRRLDVIGMLLTSSALLSLFEGLSSLSSGLWIRGTCMAIAGLALGTVCVRYSRRTPHALLKLSLFHIPLFRNALAVDLAMRLLMNSVPFLLSLLLQSDLGIQPTNAGILIVMVAFGSLMTKPFAHWLVHGIGYRITMSAGTLGTAAALALCALLTTSSSQPWIAFLLLVFGFCRSLVISTSAVLMFERVPLEDTGAATSLVGIGQQSFQVTGLTAATVFMQVAGAGAPSGHAISITIVAVALCSLSTLYFIGRMARPTPY